MNHAPMRHRAGHKRRLVVFTRCGVPGRAKTRLSGVLGDVAAAQLQQQMTAVVLSVAGEFSKRSGTDLEIHFTDGSNQRMREDFGCDFRYRPQGAGDLGRRMARVFEESRVRGPTRTVIIGADCIDIDADILEGAFKALDDADVVLGPAADGGYYLVGLRGRSGRLFEGVDRGTSRVLAQTIRTAEANGLSVALLQELADIDRPEDLTVMARRSGPATGRISVVIPSLNDEATIGSAVSSALMEGAEVIVADGSSSDGTARIAGALRATVLDVARGRARQMNAGAGQAGGDILLFLHADSRLPVGYGREVVRLMEPSHIAGGAFTFKPDRRMRGLGVIARLVNFRSRVISMPYGDQGLFVRRKTFEKIGGFPEWDIMEDYELVRRLKRHGCIAMSASAVITSADRWEDLGLMRATLVNQAVILGFHLGVSPKRLRCWYQAGTIAGPSAAARP